MKTVIEVKSSKRTYTIFDSERYQVEFYKLYFYRRGLPLMPNAFFMTIKYNRAEHRNFEDELVDFVEDNKHKLTIESIESFAKDRNALTKLSVTSVDDIEKELQRRIALLASKDYPIITKCPWKQCPFTFYCKTKGVTI